MISLGKLLSDHADGGDAGHVRAFSLLLQGIELHTIQHHKEDHERFQSDWSLIQRKLLPKIPIPDLFVLVGMAIKAFDEHNRRTAGRLRAQFSELRSIISAFSSAIAGMGTTSDVSLARLREIQSQLSAAEGMDDLRLLKTHLCDCLNGMATEVEEHKKQSASSMAALAEGVQKLETSIDRVQQPVVLDAVTGLPSRAEAEAALSKVADSGVAATAVAFVLKRVKQLNSRFGYKVGDGLMLNLSTYLGSVANPERRLYQWSGTALLAIVTRNMPTDRIRQEMRRLVNDMPMHEITIGARTVMIPVAVGWAAFPVTHPVDELVCQLEKFVNSQRSEDS